MTPSSNFHRGLQLNIFQGGKDLPQAESNTPSPSTRMSTEFFKPSTSNQELKQTKKWTKKENEIFFNAIAQYGNDTSILLRELPLRTVSQLNYHIDLMFKRIQKNIIYLRAIEHVEERCYKAHMVKQILMTLGTKFEKQKYEIHISEDIAFELLRIVNQFIILNDKDVSEVFSMLPHSNKLLIFEEKEGATENDWKISIPLINFNETVSDCDTISEGEETKVISIKTGDETQMTQIPDLFQEISCYFNRNSTTTNEKQFLNKKRESDNLELESTRTEDSRFHQEGIFSSFFKNEMFFGTLRDKSASADFTSEVKPLSLSININYKNNVNEKQDEGSEKTRTPLTEEDVFIDNPFNLSFDGNFFSSSNENEINNFNISYNSIDEDI